MDILKEKTVTARKDHKCDFCGCVIKKGEKYNRATILNDGRIYDWKAHLDCEEATSLYDMFDNDYGDGISRDDFECYIDDALHNFKYNQGRENAHLIHEDEMTTHEKVQFLLKHDKK